MAHAHCTTAFVTLTLLKHPQILLLPTKPPASNSNLKRTHSTSLHFGRYTNKSSSNCTNQPNAAHNKGGCSKTTWASSSSLNTSSEAARDTQQLWQSLTTGSQTVSVSVTTLPPATVSPPPAAPPQDESLSLATVERIVTEILEKQQQQQEGKAEVSGAAADESSLQVLPSVTKAGPQQPPHPFLFP
ncbi:uncharacterized protein V6R79_017733 [Siganus canaliculatus]